MVHNKPMRYMVAGVVALILASIATAQPIDRTPAKLREVIAVEPADSTFGAYRLVFTTDKPLPPPSDASPGQAFFLDDQKVTIPPYAPNEMTHFGYFEKLPAVAMAALRTGTSFELTRGGEPAGKLPVDVAALLAKSRPKDGEFEAPHVRRSDQSVDLVPQWADAELVCVARFVRLNSDPDDKTLWQMHFEPQGEPLRGPAAAMSKTLVFRSEKVPAWYEIGAKYVVFSRLLAGTQRIDPREHVGIRIWWPENDPVLGFLKQADACWPPSKARQDPKAREALMAALKSPAPEVRLASALALTRMGRSQAGDDALKAQVDAQIAREPVESVKQALSVLQQTSGPADRKP